MSRRFTDTDKWKKPFIRNLKAPYKLLWFYLVDDCDTAGIWEVDFDVAEIKIGEKIDSKTALSQLGKNIIEIDNGRKWFIPSFIEFQYPSGLSQINKAHSGAIKNLIKFGLIDENLKIISSYLQAPCRGAQEKEKDMDKEKDMEMEKEKEAENFKKNNPETAESETEDFKNPNYEQIVFETFRRKYPGNKHGIEKEFTNFKRHKDWAYSLPKLIPALETEINWRIEKTKSGGFVPDWKHLSTWINQRCWEQELSEVTMIPNKTEFKKPDLRINSGVVDRGTEIANKLRAERELAKVKV